MQSVYVYYVDLLNDMKTTVKTFWISMLLILTCSISGKAVDFAQIGVKSAEACKTSATLSSCSSTSSKKIKQENSRFADISYSWTTDVELGTKPISEIYSSHQQRIRRVSANIWDQPLIQVKNLQKSFGANTVLDGVTVDIYKGDVVCVIGASGSGKSTFLRCLNLLEEPTGGQILFEGTDITDKKTDINKHRQKMGMVFQQFNLFPHMTILENLTLAPMKLQGKKREETEAEAMKLLEPYGTLPVSPK